MHNNNEAQILQSWHRNAEAWTHAVPDAQMC